VPSYVNRLTDVLDRYLAPAAAPDAETTFLQRLHTSDLYLAMACGRRNETAWQRFAVLYKDYLREVTRRVYPLNIKADEIADSAMGHVYLPDASGRSRIAAFDGRSSLSFWLAVIVKRLAIREQHKWGRTESLGEHLDIADRQSSKRMDGDLRRARYQEIIHDCLSKLAGGLSARELLILQLRYLRGLKASEIADLLEVHRSSVTRQLERTHTKLRAAILARLAQLYPGGATAVGECLAEMIEDPEYASQALTFLG
jgi:RNA polymerase sigma-70 factor